MKYNHNRIKNLKKWILEDVEEKDGYYISYHMRKVSDYVNYICRGIRKDSIYDEMTNNARVIAIRLTYNNIKANLLTIQEYELYDNKIRVDQLGKDFDRLHETIEDLRV